MSLLRKALSRFLLGGLALALLIFLPAGTLRFPNGWLLLTLLLLPMLLMGAVLLRFLLHPLLMAKRIRSEEALLLRELPGYEAYTRKVRWRLLPLIW